MFFLINSPQELRAGYMGLFSLGKEDRLQELDFTGRAASFHLF